MIQLTEGGGSSFCGVWLFFGCCFILRGIAGFRMCSNFAVSSCRGQASLCLELSTVPALGSVSHAESVCVLCIGAAGEFHLGALGLSNSSHVAEALQWSCPSFPLLQLA